MKPGITNFSSGSGGGGGAGSDLTEDKILIGDENNQAEEADLLSGQGISVSRLAGGYSFKLAIGQMSTELDETNVNIEDDELAINDETANAPRRVKVRKMIQAALLDEDDMSSDSATRAPTQQSVKAYVDAEVAGAGGGGISNVVEDLTPQLGGALDINGQSIQWPTRTITDFKDEDDMASNSSTMGATQQSIKAYADTKEQALTVSHQTAVLGTETNEDFNISFLGADAIFIKSIKVTQDAGTSTSFSLRSYSDDGHSNDEVYMIGRSGFGVDASSSPIYGPILDDGINTFPIGMWYVDKDGTEELHLRARNEDFANTGQWTIELEYTLISL